MQTGRRRTRSNGGSHTLASYGGLSPRAPSLRARPEPVQLSQQTHERTQTFAELFDSVVANVGTVIQGKTDVIRLVTLALVAEGHVLIEDAPGTGKTSLAKALGRRSRPTSDGSSSPPTSCRAMS